ncbi:MAG: Smr/MutS family protein [Methylobacteriaceae bacterium]|nr:Smr/MutS family protein [Methylobacteriaceae bacterium]
MTGGPRRFRRLTDDERRLWAEIARHVVPLPGRAPAVPPPQASAPPPRPAQEALNPAPDRSALPLPVLPQRPRPFAGIERQLARDLRRGRRQVEAVLDLHGMTQDAAHAALLRFVGRAQAEGLTVVQVVTGKGGARAGDNGPERGVLRRLVPHWLALAPLREQVLGFEEAAPHRGGAGALYLRLRRRRG